MLSYEIFRILSKAEDKFKDLYYKVDFDEFLMKLYDMEKEAHDKRIEKLNKVILGE